jgi:hypothetical protein
VETAHTLVVWLIFVEDVVVVKDVFVPHMEEMNYKTQIFGYIRKLILIMLQEQLQDGDIQIVAPVMDGYGQIKS